MTNELVKTICKALSDKKALDIKIITIKAMTDIADYFIICSGKSAPQVKALYDSVDEVLSSQGIEPQRTEGVAEGRWIAMDYQNVVVHIFHQETREFYQLDKLWNNGANVVDYTD